MIETIHPPTIETVRPLTLDERLSRLNRKFFIRYPAAIEILKELTELAHPENALRQDLCIVGVPGNGKSQLVKALMRSFPMEPNPKGDAAIIPAVYIKMPGKANAQLFAKRLLKALGQTRKPGTKDAELLERAITVLDEVGTKILILDDIQHMNVGAPKEKDYLRNSIKELGELCDLSVVAVGTPAAVGVISSDTQIQRRFEFRPLPEWQFNDHSRSFLVQVEKFLQLGFDSGIGFDETLTRRIIADAEGTLGNMVKIIRRAATYAIKSGEERITCKTLDRIGWIMPSQQVAKAGEVVGYRPDLHG